MNDIEIEAVKQTLNTPGWPLVELLMEEAFTKRTLDTSKTDAEIASEAKANEKMDKAYQDFKSKLLSLNKIQKDNIIYQ